MIQPIDYRNANWDAIKQRMVGVRLLVYRAWCNYGPGTTRVVSDKSGIDILTFRPRTTELFDLGFVELSDSPPGAIRAASHEGVYRAVQWKEVHARFVERKRLAVSNYQPELQLGRLAQPESIKR